MTHDGAGRSSGYSDEANEVVEPMQGDANTDGTVDALDLELVYRDIGLAVGEPALESVWEDVNGDGVITLLDLDMIYQIIEECPIIVHDP